MNEYHYYAEDDDFIRSDDIYGYVKYIWRYSIKPYWTRYGRIVPEIDDWLIEASDYAMSCLAYEIGQDKDLSIKESGVVLEDILALQYTLRHRPAEPVFDPIYESKTEDRDFKIVSFRGRMVLRAK